MVLVISSFLLFPRGGFAAERRECHLQTEYFISRPIGEQASEPLPILGCPNGADVFYERQQHLDVQGRNIHQRGSRCGLRDANIRD
jgi:hypothetical protein